MGEVVPLNPFLDAALAWAARGFKVFPITPGKKNPPPLGWQEMATRDPDEIRKLWTGKHNVGVLAEGIVVDLDDKAGKTGSFDWDMTEGDKPATLTVLTPTGGRHLYYATAEATAQPKLTNSIDTRAGGLGYTLAPGSVTGDGTYALLEDLPVAPAPQWLVEHCQERGERITWDGDVTLDTDEALALAADYLEGREGAVEGKGGDLWTFKTACGVIDFGISAELCLDLMVEHWNARCAPSWEIEALQIKVDSAWKNRRNKPGVKSPEIEFGGVNVPEVPKPQKSGLLWAGDLSIPINQDWLLHDRLPRVGVGLLVGRSGCGKTYLSLDLAARLARCEPWLWETGDEKVGTVILAAEGIGGLPLRIKHLNDIHGVIPVAATTVRSFRDKTEQNAIEERLREARDMMLREYGVRLGLIIVDTLAASGLFENENDSMDIHRGLQGLQNLAEQFDCFVLGTHHPPKTGHGPRGSYALFAGVDAVIEVFDQADEHIVECTKARDAETGWWGSYALDKVVVEPNFNKRGRDRTTMRVVHGKEKRGSPKPAEPAIESQETLIRLLDDIRSDLGQSKGAPVPVEKVRASLSGAATKGKGQSFKALEQCLEWMILRFPESFLVNTHQGCSVESGAK